MKESILKQIESGGAPLHIASIKNHIESENQITKIRSSKRYNSNHLQIGFFYKSSI
jgi:hypothetical protein